MHKMLYKLNVINEYCIDPLNVYSHYRDGLFHSYTGYRESDIARKIYINLYDIASIEEHIKRACDGKCTLDGYVLKMSNGTYLISTEDAQEIIKILQCVN